MPNSSILTKHSTWEVVVRGYVVTLPVMVLATVKSIHKKAGGSGPATARPTNFAMFANPLPFIVWRWVMDPERSILYREQS